MADLDDFFAKKDKKKSKKPKFLTAEELVKNLERETVVKPKKPEPSSLSSSSAPVSVSASASVSTTTATTAAPSTTAVVGDESKPKVVEQPSAEEEWKEFEEEQRKDYSGLKIGQLTINEDEGESSGEGGEIEDGESDGNGTNAEPNAKGSGSGPWKKVIPAEEVTQIPMEIEKPTSKVYISPALRGTQNVTPGLRLKTSRRAAPDITNAEFFPTLDAARPEEQRKKRNEPAFEEVRHGSRVQRVQEATANPVSVTNRFQSLDDDDS